MSDNPPTKKSLGQHWLNDAASLRAMVEAGEVSETDTVLEIGPGPGALTRLLVKEADQVTAVEFDDVLAQTLPSNVPAGNLKVVKHDILSFDFTSLPADYKVVANIPYYLTSNLIRILSETTNQPSRVVLLVQQEVAQRVCAVPGDMSILSITAQYFWETSLGRVVKADLFMPPPKVDSQILIMRRHPGLLFPEVDSKAFFRLVKAGFGERRKMLRGSLSGGLRVSKPEAEALLRAADIDPTLRAQALSLEDWRRLYAVAETRS